MERELKKHDKQQFKNIADQKLKERLLNAIKSAPPDLDTATER